MFKLVGPLIEGDPPTFRPDIAEDVPQRPGIVELLGRVLTIVADNNDGAPAVGFI